MLPCCLQLSSTAKETPQSEIGQKPEGREESDLKEEEKRDTTPAEDKKDESKDETKQDSEVKEEKSGTKKDTEKILDKLLAGLMTCFPPRRRRKGGRGEGKRQGGAHSNGSSRCEG